MPYLSVSTLDLKINLEDLNERNLNKIDDGGCFWVSRSYFSREKKLALCSFINKISIRKWRQRERDPGLEQPSSSQAVWNSCHTGHKKLTWYFIDRWCPSSQMDSYFFICFGRGFTMGWLFMHFVKLLQLVDTWTRSYKKFQRRVATLR